MDRRKLVSPVIIGQGNTGTIALQGNARLFTHAHIVCNHIEQRRLPRAAITTYDSDIPLNGEDIFCSPAAGNLNEMRTVHKQHLQIRNRLMNQLGHVMDNAAAVHDLYFKFLATKVHHVI